MKVWLSGLNGRMGQEIAELIKQDDSSRIEGGSGFQYLKNQFQEKKSYTPSELAENLNKVDLVIDFSNSAGNKTLLEASQILEKPIAFMIGTTGLSRDQRNQWKQLCKEHQHKLIFAPNTSLGVLLTMKLSQEMAKVLQPNGFDIEIIESHHKHKVDSPSGTAKFLADRICDVVPLKVITERKGKREDSELGVFALRGGSVFGEHEVRFLGEHEELSLSHRALSRTLFAKGAIILGKWILKQPAGQHYGLTDVSLKELI